MFRNQPWNLKEMTFREHLNWHLLFRLMTPLEAFDWVTSDSFQLDAFDSRQWRAWRILFDHKDKYEAAGVILSDWMPDHCPEGL